MSDTIEHWLPVVGYDFEYEVSDLGNVRISGQTAPLNQHGSTKYGYRAVSLRQHGRSVPVYVHRLVCIAFHANPENKRYVDHINTQPADNRACNLRWTTASENACNELTLEHSREAQHKRMEDPAQRQHLREATLNLNQDQEYKQRQAEGFARRWQNPEEHAAQSARTTAYFSNPENRKKARACKENIIKACQCIETGITYDSFMDAQRATGIPAANISRTCRAYANGKILHAGGFTWRYPTQTKALK